MSIVISKRKNVLLVFFLLSFYLFVVGKSAQATPPCCAWPTPVPHGLSPWIDWPPKPSSTPAPQPTSPPPSSHPTATPTSGGQPAPTSTTAAPGVPTAIPTLAPSSAGDSGGGIGGAGGVGEAVVCTNTVPPAPTLLKVAPAGAGQVSLTWTAVNPITHYSISYGLLPGNYIYGVPNTGNTTSFTIGNLQPKVNYCFAVRAVNDCAPSSLSNEKCSGGGVARVLGATVLGATGSVDELVPILVIIGSICVALGLRNVLPSHREA